MQRPFKKTKEFALVGCKPNHKRLKYSNRIDGYSSHEKSKMGRVGFNFLYYSISNQVEKHFIYHLLDSDTLLLAISI